jgi:crotonobetainyl-CoA:carnitine CoA-transferase CaiB-like acyl-CoA transferase
MQEGALSDVKILSFAQIAQGNAAVQYLADLGADVIKVERPGKGAWERTWSGLDLYINGESVFFLALNRNQRSLTVNLKEEKGKKIIYKLIKQMDVVVENFRPGVMDRLGLGYEKLSEINPRLIYASASGYGPDGPYRDRPGQDLLAQALGGLASVTGKKDDLPTPVGTPAVDIHSAALMALGIMAALHYRDKTGKGQKVDVNLLQSAIDLQIEPFTYYLNGGGEKSINRSKTGIGAPFYEAPYGIYATQDGYIALSLIPLKKLAKALELDELMEYDQRDALEKRDEIRPLIDKVIKNKTTSEWLTIFEKDDIWCAPVKNYAELVEDPQVKHNQVIKELEREDLGSFKVITCPITLSQTKPTIRNVPPKLGEHTRSILGLLGYDDETMEQLEEEGVI